MTQLNNLGDHVDGTLIAESQSQKATTSNAVDNLVSDATQKIFDITITTDRTLTDDEFFGNKIFNLSGTPASDFSLFVPASGEHDFTVINGTDKICTIDATGGAGATVALQESLAGSFHSDGTDILAGVDPDIMKYGSIAVDGAADFFLFWDVSTGLLKRVLGDNLPGAGSSAGSGAFPYKGCVVTLTANQSIPDNTATEIAFTTEIHDEGVWHDNATNNTRLTVPTGVKRVQLVASARWDNNGTGVRNLEILMNGVTIADGNGRLEEPNSDGVVAHVLTSHIIDVVPTNYFELSVLQTSGGSLNALSAANLTSFSIRAVETTESGLAATVQTTDATQTVITNGAMAADSAHTIRATVQGREDATGDTYHASIFGGARNEGGTSSAPTPNVVEVTDAGASTWDATLVANDTTDVWEIKVTGEAAHTIDWTVTYFEIIQ